MSGTITAIAAAAAVVSAGVGVYEAGQAHKLAGQQMGQSSTIFGEQQSYQSQLQELIANPSSVSQLPGYQFQLDQGSEAVARTMGARELAGSGNEAAALAQYGQGLAQNFYTTQTELLSRLSGVTAPSSPAQSGAVAAGAQANSAQQTEQLLQQLGIAYVMAGAKYSPASTPSSAAPGWLGAGTGGTPGAGDPSAFAGGYS